MLLQVQRYPHAIDYVLWMGFVPRLACVFVFPPALPFTRQRYIVLPLLSLWSTPRWEFGIVGYL